MNSSRGLHDESSGYGPALLLHPRVAVSHAAEGHPRDGIAVSRFDFETPHFRDGVGGGSSAAPAPAAAAGAASTASAAGEAAGAAGAGAAAAAAAAGGTRRPGESFCPLIQLKGILRSNARCLFGPGVT
jgi:hypothetical protein